MTFLSPLIAGLTSPGKAVYAIIDTETTGLSAKRDRIIELGVVLTDKNFREVERWGSLINPEKKITNSAIHGITDAMVANAPTFAQVFGEFVRKIDGLHLMAHNAPYDGKMLVGEIERFSAECAGDLTLPLIDTIELAKLLTTGPYKLEALAKKCRVFNPNAHAAVDDAATTAAVMRKLGAGKLTRNIHDQGVPFEGTLIEMWPLDPRPALPR